jgi:hypothetical protein
MFMQPLSSPTATRYTFGAIFTGATATAVTDRSGSSSGFDLKVYWGSVDTVSDVAPL